MRTQGIKPSFCGVQYIHVYTGGRKKNGELEGRMVAGHRSTSYGKINMPSVEMSDEYVWIG